MRKKFEGDPYRFADIIIAVILGGVIGLVLSGWTGELFEPIVFHGDIVVVCMLVCGGIGVVGGQQSTHMLEDLLKLIRDLLYRIGR